MLDADPIHGDAETARLWGFAQETDLQRAARERNRQALCAEAPRSGEERTGLSARHVNTYPDRFIDESSVADNQRARTGGHGYRRSDDGPLTGPTKRDGGALFAVRESCEMGAGRGADVDGQWRAREGSQAEKRLGRQQQSDECGGEPPRTRARVFRREPPVPDPSALDSSRRIACWPRRLRGR